MQACLCSSPTPARTSGLFQDADRDGSAVGQVGEELRNRALHVLRAATGRCRALALLSDEWHLS